jgi:hypothetical protein
MGISPKPQEALNLLVTEERYWAPFHMPLHTFLHNSLNVLVQIADKMGLQKEKLHEISVRWADVWDNDNG